MHFLGQEVELMSPDDIRVINDVDSWDKTIQIMLHPLGAADAHYDKSC